MTSNWQYERPSRQPGPSTSETDSDDVDSKSWPSLRIHHLLLWTAIVAIVLSLSKLWTLALSLLSENVPPHVQIGIGLTHAVFLSGAVGVAGLLVAWLHAGCRARVEPGQWMLMDMTIRAILIISFAGVVTLVLTWFPDADIVHVVAAAGAVLSYMIVVFVYDTRVAMYNAHAISWRIFFHVRSLSVVIHGMLGSMAYLIQWGATLAGIRHDRRRAIRRHWTHWYGIVAQVAVDVATYVYWQYR